MPAGELRSRNRPPLPQVASLRGRERELERIEGLLADHDVAIVTLWGPGGIGKTSLALTGVRRAEAFDDVAFASLSADANVIDVLRSAGAALGAPITRARSVAEGTRRLGDVLASRGRVLLVLDNAETCIAAAAELVAAWRALAPRAKLLVTSREPLGVAGEHILAVPPLALPGRDDDPRSSDAGALLLERAREIRADFDPPQSLFAELVARTEGIPLAIELCAARLDVLSASELAERLAKSRAVLSTPRRDVEERHRTLFASIALSHRLLDDVERRALSDLATTVSPFDLESAEAIVAAPFALDVVESLVRKSLLRRYEHEGRTRFAFYDAVRAFVRELGDAGADAEHRHATHFAAHASALGTAADGPSGAAAIAKLASLEDELAMIVARYTAAPRDAMAAEVETALLATYPLAVVRGPIATFVDRARAVLLATPDKLSPRARGRIESALGHALLFLSELEEAQQVLERSEARLAAAGASLDRAEALYRLSEVLSEQGNYEAARETQAEALTLAGDNPRIAGLCFLGSGRVAHLRSDITGAREQYTRGLALLRRAGDARSESRMIGRLGFVAYDEGDMVEARACFAEALRLSTEVGDLRGAAFAVGYMGNTLRAEGAIDEAIARYEDVIATMRSAGDRLYEAVFRMDLGIACLLDARFARAREELELAISSTRDGGHHHLGALLAGYLVSALAMSGEHEAAVRAAATARSGTIDAPDRACLDAHEWTANVLASRDPAVARDAQKWLDATAGALPKAEHVRLARRLLAQVLGRLGAADRALVLDRGRVRPPLGGWIDLSTRPALAGLVLALAERHLASPGATLSQDELLAAGWPGERVRPSAAAIRIRVAMANLRKLGFASILGRAIGGYRLDPDVVVIDARGRSSGESDLTL